MAKYVIGRRSEVGSWEWWNGKKCKWGPLRGSTKYASFSTVHLDGADCIIEYVTAKKLATEKVSNG